MLLPALVLVATWLPGFAHGWPRTDSHRYAALALDCYRDSPFWAPTLGDMPYFNKPPLVMWIEGALLSITGPDVWAIRLPTLLAALGTLVLTIDLTRRLSGARAATLAGLVLATTMEFFRYTRAISLDMWVALFGVLLVWSAVRAARSGRARWFAVGGLAIGAGLMVKPFVVLLPAVIVGLWLVWERKPRMLVPLGGAILLGLALAAPWHAAMIRRFGEAFTQNYFLAETLDRADGLETTTNPWWYTLASLPQTYWPWIVTLALACEAIVRRRFRPSDRPAVRLALVWSGAWLLALTLFGDQRTRYMVPLYPLMSILSGLWLARLLPASIRRPGRAATPIVVACVVVLAAGVNLLPASALDVIHKPRHAKWDAILEYQRAHGDEHIWTTPEYNTAGANLYLMTGAYPRLAGPTRAGDGERAPAGSLIIAHKDEEAALGAFGEVVLSKSDMRMIRLDRPWPPAGETTD